MKNKKILVLLKYFKGELNPFDGAALEVALETGAKDITVLTMAPESVYESFRSLTRLGVKGVFVSDPLYAGSDTQATSLVLCEAIRRIDPDIIFCGRQSVDGDTAQVPPMLAERLGYDIKTKIVELNGLIARSRSGEEHEIKDRTILTFEKIRTLRFPSIFSKIGEVLRWDNSTLKLHEDKCGLNGSPTRVVKSYESNVGRRDCAFVDQSELKGFIEEGLRKSRVEIVQNKGERLDEVYFVGKVEAIAEQIANKTIRLDVDGKTPLSVADELLNRGATTVLWEDSEDYKILASRVAVITGAGLCADCISFRVENGK